MSPRNTKGENYFKLTKYERAIESKERALSVYKELGDDLEVASTYESLGMDFSVLNKNDRALEYISKATEVYKNIGREDKLAETLDSLGMFYKNAGKSDQAIEYYKQALRIHKKYKNLISVGLTLEGLGSTYSSNGNNRKALEAYELALKIYQEQNNKSLYMGALSSVANIFKSRGEYDKAIEIYKRYLYFSKKEKDVLGVYGSYFDIGSVYSAWTKYDIALKYYEHALEASEGFDPHYRKISQENVRVALGYNYLYMGNVDEASEYLSAALETAKKNEDKGSVANILKGISGIHGAKKDYKKQIALLEQALKIYSDRGPKVAVARSQLEIGTAYLRLKKYDKAREYLYQSLSIARNIQNADVWEDINHVIAALLIREKQYAEAIKFLNEAVKAIENLRKTAVGDIRRDVLASKIVLYKYLAMAYLVSGDFSNSFSAIEKSRSRFLMDNLLGEGEELSIPKVNQIQMQMNASSAVLAFGSFDARGDGSEILIEYVITRDSSKGYFKSTAALLPQFDRMGAAFSKWNDSQRETKKVNPFDAKKPENNLQKLVRYYRFLLAKPSNENAIAINEIGRVLYELLIKPHLPELRGKKNLLIIPDGILNFVPFETLINEEGHYLVEKFNISYAQSVAVIKLLEKRKYEEKRKPMLAFGGAVYEPDISEQNIIETDVQLSALTSNTLTSLSQNNTRSASEAFARLGYKPWSNLPGTKLEVEAINAIVKNSKIVVGNDVSETNVKDMSANGELSQYKVIHFATHGMTVPELPELSSIILSQFKGGQGNEDGYLRMEEISKLKLNADFVNLSACQTGLGKLYAGEGVVGLTHAFLTAGANGLSVSLWNVADESTAMFMVGLYQLVEQKGMSYSQAINEMKRAFIRGQVSMDTFEPNRGINFVSLDKAKPGKLSHPFYWAPFVYYGKN